MSKLRIVLCAAALAVGTGAAAMAQPSREPVPEGPFKTVHLMVVPAGQDAALRAEVTDMNRVFKAEGCATCAYHLYKLAGTRSQYNYMMLGEWPGRDGYVAVHKSAAFKEAGQRNAVMGKLFETQIYGRYEEVK